MSILKPKAFWPLSIGSSNNKIYYKYTAGVDGIGTIASATYYDAETLRAAIQTAITSGTNPLTTATVTVSATGLFIFSDIASFSMRWSLTTNSIYSILGNVAVDMLATNNAGTWTCTSTAQHQNGWYSPAAVIDDTFPVRDRAMDMVTRNVGGQTKFTSEAELTEREIVLAFLPPEKTYITFATGVYLNQALESWWVSGRARFRYWIDGTGVAYNDYVFEQETARMYKPVRMYKRKALYQVKLKFWGFV